MSVQLLVIYPPPKDPVEFDRAYREVSPVCGASARRGHGSHDEACAGRAGR